MAEGRPGLFGTALRAFLATLFGVLGIVAGIVVIILAIGIFSFGGRQEVQVSGNYEVLAGSNWETEPLRHGTPLILHLGINGFIGREKLSPEKIREQLVRTRSGGFEGRVKAILLSINSPGGYAIAADTIYRLVKEYSEQFDVPVYAYTDGLCASGGYLIACAADKIYAATPSIIGSVGVLANFVNVSEGLEKIGVKTLTLTQGKDKDSLNPLRPWKENEDEQMKRISAFYYDRFVDTVVASRPNLPKEELVQVYGAQVFPGPLAAENGFIDGVEESETAVLELLAKDAGLENYQVVSMETENWLQQLFQMNSPLLTGKLKLETLTPPTGYCYLYQE